MTIWVWKRTNLPTAHFLLGVSWILKWWRDLYDPIRHCCQPNYGFPRFDAIPSSERLTDGKIRLLRGGNFWCQLADVQTLMSEWSSINVNTHRPAHDTRRQINFNNLRRADGPSDSSVKWEAAAFVSLIHMESVGAALTPVWPRIHSGQEGFGILEH